MKQRISALCLLVVMLLSLGTNALASGEDLGDKLKDVGDAIGEFAQAFGQAAGDTLSDWGAQLKEFSEDPDAYIDQNEFMRSVRDTANELGQSLKEYWPTLKEALVGSMETVVDSSMSWDDKKAALKQYAQLAIPYLKEVQFSSVREEALSAMELAASFLEGTIASDASWADKQELIQMYEEEIGRHVADLIGEGGDETLAASYEALKAVFTAGDEAQAKSALDALHQQIQALK